VENGELKIKFHLTFKFELTTKIHKPQTPNKLMMDGKNRKDIYPGLEVDIILKKDQRNGVRTRGIVQALLTSSAFHTRGIKVRLEDGQVGRVVEIFE
jgi:uncharacterized repeat protein (TIGR03833 family)